jgi:hypothetical protein
LRDAYARACLRLRRRWLDTEQIEQGGARSSKLAFASMRRFGTPGPAITHGTRNLTS